VEDEVTPVIPDAKEADTAIIVEPVQPVKPKQADQPPLANRDAEARAAERKARKAWKPAKEPGMIQAPNPRQPQKDGAAALVAAGKMKKGRVL